MYLTELPSGSWRVSVKHNGLRRTATAPTKDEASLLGHELELELGAKKRAADNVTVGYLLNLHLISIKPDWSPTTWHDANIVARALPPLFKERIVREVDAAVVAGLYRELTRNNWSPHRLRRVRMVLSTAWTTAISYRWASVNPTRDAKPPKLPHRAITPPDRATVDRILTAAGETQFGLFLRLAAATGARRGELIALRWTDLQLDRDRGLCRITHSLVWTKDGMAERDTKTAVKGHRTIKLGSLLTKRLTEHRDTQLERAVIRAAGRFTPTWVFTNAEDEPWRGDYVSRLFRHTCTKAEVTGVRLHDLRHHMATDQLAQGRSVHRVSQRLGHASTATTQRVYSHFIEEDDDMADDLDDRFG